MENAAGEPMDEAEKKVVSMAGWCLLLSMEKQSSTVFGYLLNNLKA